MQESQDSHKVMSEEVQALAGDINQELESIRATYGEDAVKTLTPLLTNVLDRLDSGYRRNEERALELKLLRLDHDQLVIHNKREELLRTIVERKQSGEQGDDEGGDGAAPVQVNMESASNVAGVVPNAASSPQQQPSNPPPQSGEQGDNEGGDGAAPVQVNMESASNVAGVVPNAASSPQQQPSNPPPQSGEQGDDEGGDGAAPVQVNMESASNGAGVVPNAPSSPQQQPSNPPPVRA